MTRSTDRSARTPRRRRDEAEATGKDAPKRTAATGRPARNASATRTAQDPSGKDGRRASTSRSGANDSDREDARRPTRSGSGTNGGGGEASRAAAQERTRRRRPEPEPEPVEDDLGEDLDDDEDDGADGVDQDDTDAGADEPDDEDGADEADEADGDEPTGEPEPPARPQRVPARRVARWAAEQVEEMTGKSAESVTSVRRGDDGWVVGLEVVEASRVPTSTDMLATYEAEMDDEGELISYRRMKRYTRGRSDDE